MTKTALVTGANKGIGKAIVRGLADLGMTVFLGARDLELGRKAAAELGGTIEAVQLDVTKPEEVAAVARRLGRLDVLVNNAGAAVPAQVPDDVTASEFREVFETNVFGVVTVTRAMLPLLRRASAGRIVNVSSLRGSLGDEGAFVGQPSMPYSSSKTALNALTVHYARGLADTPIKVNAAAPGHVATDFNNYRGTRTPEEGAAIAIRLATLGADGPTGGFFDDNGQVRW